MSGKKNCKFIDGVTKEYNMDNLKGSSKYMAWKFSKLPNPSLKKNIRAEFLPAYAISIEKNCLGRDQHGFTEKCQ